MLHLYFISSEVPFDSFIKEAASVSDASDVCKAVNTSRLRVQLFSTGVTDIMCSLTLSNVSLESSWKRGPWVVDMTIRDRIFCRVRVDNSFAWYYFVNDLLLRLGLISLCPHWFVLSLGIPYWLITMPKQDEVNSNEEIVITKGVYGFQTQSGIWTTVLWPPAPRPRHPSLSILSQSWWSIHQRGSNRY